MTTDSDVTREALEPTNADASGGVSKLSWWEFQVPDLASAQAFYGALFGWTFAPFGETYSMVHAPDGTMIGGLDQVDTDASGRHVRVYFNVDDLESTLDTVRAAGGSVHEDRKLISDDYGWYATVADPSGLRFGLTTGSPPR